MKVLIACLLFAGLAHANWVKEMENENPPSFGEEDENEERFVEGDIRMTKAEYQEMLTGSHVYGSKVGGRWPNPSKIPYVIHSSLRSQSGAMAGINAAIKSYKDLLCLQLVPRTNERNYIQFGGYTRGCSSPVGFNYNRPVNGISLASRGCWGKGTIMHEIGHSLGLWHEQSRPDRDQYVEILFDKIKSANRHNFNKMNGIESLGTRYDYKSMMHYGKSAFSIIWGQTTIRTKVSAFQNQIGQRNGPSQIDIQQIKLMYPALPATCGGSGPDPNCKDQSRSCSRHDTGLCKSPANWAAWMAKYCKKYCGLC